MARYDQGTRRGPGTWGEGTYDMDYNAGFRGLENEPGGPTARGWPSMYPVRTRQGRNRGMGYDTGFRRPRAHGAYDRFDYGVGRRFEGRTRGGYMGSRDMGVTFGNRGVRARGYVGGRGMYDNVGGGLGRSRERYRGPNA